MSENNEHLLYELHITVNKAEAEIATAVAKDLHWKTSQIDGDPVLGAKPFFYLTTYSPTEQVARLRLDNATAELRARGVFVIREKIELIIHDVRHA